MIRSLRRRHRLLVVAIGTATGLLLVLGLLSRRPPPRVPSLGELDRAESAGEAAPVVDR
ncbi:MAG TPA: hypothetical protein VD788_04085 [Candidatus Polarisedimenticolaceae bacterium]|nr:hypothetical protein [Candidatus Polarisedimenticolaceae bacterium]